MMGRSPTVTDLERMQRALAIVTAYDIGAGGDGFDTYAELLQDVKHPLAMVESVAQFAWLLLKSMDESGIDRHEVLDWYGKRFALHAEELRG